MDSGYHVKARAAHHPWLHWRAKLDEISGALAAVRVGHQVSLKNSVKNMYSVLRYTR